MNTKQLFQTLFLILVTAGLFLFAIQTANADDLTSLQNRFYIGGDIGSGGMQTDSTTRPNNTVNDAISYHAYLGYAFPLNSNVSIAPEIGILGYSDNTYNTTIKNGLVYSGSTIELLINTRYQYSDSIYGFVKAGVGIVKQDLKEKEYSSSSLSAYSTSETIITRDGFKYHSESSATENSRTTENSASTSKVLPELVLGVGWDINEHLGLYLSYTQLFAATHNIQPGASIENSNSVAPVSVTAIGVQYNF